MTPSRGLALRDLAQRVGRRFKTAGDVMLGRLCVGVLRVIRVASRKRMADVAGAFMRTAGRRLKEHEIGRANLAAAFPEKSPAEIEAILRGVWDNLGRVAAEFAHIDRLRCSPYPRLPYPRLPYPRLRRPRLRRPTPQRPTLQRLTLQRPALPHLNPRRQSHRRER
jgi:Bacterial lipid A biosynthesis acyltransferase